MQKFKHMLLVPAVLVLALAAVVPLAAAERGNSDDRNTVATTVADNDTSSTSTDDTTSTGASEPLTEDSANHKGSQMVQAMLARRHSRQSDAARSRKCAAAKHGLTTKLTNLQKNAAKHKALIDKIYSQAQSYQQENNLNPANFSDLTAAADAAQAKAADSVSVLDGLSVNLDCSSNSVASNVAAFKVAAQQTRSDLLAYRKAVVAVLQALESAKQQ